MMRRFCVMSAVIFVLITTLTLKAHSGSFYSLSHDDYQGYLIKNNSKWCLGAEGTFDHDAQPGAVVKFPGNYKTFLYEWILRSSKEPYIYNLTYHFLLNKQNNVLTINDHNSGLNGYPWTFTKTGNNNSMIVNVSSNCGDEVYVSLNNFEYTVYKLPAKVDIDVKKVFLRVGFYLKNNNKVYSTLIHLPFQYKGGIFNLRFDLNKSPTTIVSMLNDDNKHLKLQGCDGLERIDNLFYPSGYDGNMRISDLVFSYDDLRNGSSEVYSSNFSYDIVFNKQYSQAYQEDYEILRNDTPSRKTEINLGDYFNEDMYIDIYKKNSGEFEKRDLKHYLADNDKYLTFRLHNKSGSIVIDNQYIPGATKTTVNVGFVNDFTCKSVYKSKGLQFYQTRSYYLSGLTLYKDNPVKMIDGKMFINPKLIVSQVDGSINTDDKDSIVMLVKFSDSKTPSTISIDKQKLAMTVDGELVKFEDNLMLFDDGIYVPLESFAKLLKCNTKYYPQTKTLCVTYDYAK